MNYTTHAENVTRRLVDMIQTGSHGQWAMPWHSHDLGDLLSARNATTGNRYAGANVLTLALDALERGYPTGEWATYTQWQTAGAQVRKGEHAAHIIKWVTTKTSDNADTETDEVDEDAAIGASVGVTASANDADATDTVSYALTDSAGGRFCRGRERRNWSGSSRRLRNFQTPSRPFQEISFHRWDRLNAAAPARSRDLQPGDSRRASVPP